MLKVLPLEHFPTFFGQIDLIYYFQGALEHCITEIAPLPGFWAFNSTR